MGPSNSWACSWKRITRSSELPPQGASFAAEILDLEYVAELPGKAREW